VGLLWDWCLDAVARPRQISRDRGQGQDIRGRDREEAKAVKIPPRGCLETRQCFEAPHHWFVGWFVGSLVLLLRAHCGEYGCLAEVGALRALSS